MLERDAVLVNIDVNSLGGIESHSKASTKDFAWFLARLRSSNDDTKQTVPGWSGFNAIAKQTECPIKKRGWVQSAHRRLSNRAFHSLHFA